MARFFVNTVIYGILLVIVTMALWLAIMGPLPSYEEVRSVAARFVAVLW